MATEVDVYPPIAHLGPVAITNDPSKFSLVQSAVAFLQPAAAAPFDAIRSLFDHLQANPEDATKLNDSYPERGVFKTAATRNPDCDQKLTIDLSLSRVSRIQADLRTSLSAHGLDEVLSFFSTIVDSHVSKILSGLTEVSGVDMVALHRSQNFNFRLCDYTPATASPDSANGCGSHRDYGTFAIIFQDGHAGLEAEAPDAPGVWVPIPGDATVFLCGWCALILSGGLFKAVPHRVRRSPGVRRLSAVLFIAPDLDVTLKPMVHAEGFSDEVMNGEIDVKWFKADMGRSWRRREGNEALLEGEEISQDKAIERLVWK